MGVDIEQLCKELHEKVGLDKSIKITIEEGNPTKSFLWSKSELLKNEDHPFRTVRTSEGTQWRYKIDHKKK